MLKQRNKRHTGRQATEPHERLKERVSVESTIHSFCFSHYELQDPLVFHTSKKLFTPARNLWETTESLECQRHGMKIEKLCTTIDSETIEEYANTIKCSTHCLITSFFSLFFPLCISANVLPFQWRPPNTQRFTTLC